jgi:hypothetical protein
MEISLKVLFFIIVLGLFLPESHQTRLSGYQADIKTIVYEDGSISRTIALNLNPDVKESTKWKREFFIKNGYRVEERNQDDDFLIVASKVYTPSKENGTHFNDEFSRISLQRQADEFLFKEEFLTAFVMGEISASDLRDDKPAAKLLLADTQYNFFTTMPGKIAGVSSGEFNKNAAHWNFDIEQLFNHTVLEMATTSTIARDENVIWLILLTGVLLVTMGVLFLLKNRKQNIV